LIGDEDGGPRLSREDPSDGLIEEPANGTISRRRILWLAGTVLLGSVTPMFLFPDEAEAGRRRRRRRRKKAASTVTPTACGGGTTLSSDEKRILDLHNQTRARYGLPPLCVHPALTKAARSHSQDMLDRDYSSHTSPDGETVKERIERFGYTFSGYSYYRYGENIYWGYGSSSGPDNAFDWWMSSSDHRANILNKDFRDIGIGVRKGTYKTHGETTMYTVDFGVRR
jgi:uncharacterized protein YkwD